MKKEFKGIQRKGLPGGPHEQFTYVTGVFMQDMYHVPEAQEGLEKYQGDEKSETDNSFMTSIYDWWYNYDDYKPRIKRGDKVDNSWMMNWLSDPETQRRIVNSSKGTKTDQDAKKEINKAKKNIKTVPVIGPGVVNTTDLGYALDRMNMPSGYISGLSINDSNPSMVGHYNKGNHYIKLNKDWDPSTITHELTHATGFNDYQLKREMDMLRAAPKKENWQEKYLYDKAFVKSELGPFSMENYKKMISDPDNEMFIKNAKQFTNYLIRDGSYPLIMEVRRQLNAKPGQLINSNDFDKLKKSEALKKLRIQYDDENIIKILNTVAATDNNNDLNIGKEGQEIIVSKDGQYAHPGKITRIPGNNITMKGVPYPVYAIPNVGMPTIMQSGQDYYFPDADYVDEIPMMYQGGTLPKYQISGPENIDQIQSDNTRTANIPMFTADEIAKAEANQKNSSMQTASQLLGLNRIMPFLETLQVPEATIAYGIQKLKGNDPNPIRMLPRFMREAKGYKDETQLDLVSSLTSDEFVERNPMTSLAMGLMIPGGFANKANKAKKAVNKLPAVGGSIENQMFAVNQILKSLKQRGKRYDESYSDIDIAKIFNDPDKVEYIGTRSGRPLVRVEMPDGYSEYFYKSSGWAGKKGEGVGGTTQGLWQPFGGHAESMYAPGWFIKDSGYKDYYGSNTFKTIANNLDDVLIRNSGFKDVDELNKATNFRNTQGKFDTYDLDFSESAYNKKQGGENIKLPKYQGNKTSETPSFDLDFLMQGFPTVAAESTRVDTNPVPDSLPVNIDPTRNPEVPDYSIPMPVPTKTQETQYITEDKTSAFERGLQTLANPTGTNIDIPLSVLNPFAYMQGAYTAGTEALEGNLLPATGAVVASRLPFLRPYVYNPVTKKGAKKLAQSKPGQFLSRAYEKTLGDKNLTIPLTGLGLFQGAAYDIPQFVSNFEKGEYYEAANDLFNAGTAFVPLATNLADTYKFGLGSFENLIGDAFRNFQQKRKLNKAVRNYKGPIYQEDLRNSSIYNSYNKGFNEKTKHIFYDVEDEYRFYYPELTDSELAYMVLRDPKILDLNAPVRKINSLQQRVGDISFGHNLSAQPLTKFKDRPDLFSKHLPDEDILSSYPRPTSVEALILESYTDNQAKFNNPLRGFQVKRNTGELADSRYVNQTTSDTEILKDLILKQQLTRPTSFQRMIRDFKTKIYDRDGNFLREDLISNMKPGENFQDLGFTSVAYSTLDFSPTFPGDIKMIINAPKGQSAIVPNRYPSLTRFPKENEAILPPNLRYELDEYGQFNIINPYKEGGSVAKEVDKDMLNIYANYINGTDESEDAINAYNKLNRIFYKESKLKNMSVPNYIMTHVIPNA